MNNIGHCSCWGGGGLSRSDNIFLQIVSALISACFPLTLYIQVWYINLNFQFLSSDKIMMFSSHKGMTRSCALDAFNSLLYRKTSNV